MNRSPRPRVVVTGSTRGLGHSLASAFAAQGCDVMVCGRDPGAAADAALRLRSTGGLSVIGSVGVDMTDPDSVEHLWQESVATLGGVDLWVNNAGVAHTTQPIVDTPPDAVHTMVTTNMMGTILGSQTAVRGMLAAGGGQVFNVLGGGSDGRIRPNMGVYGATKRGLDGFTRALAHECAQSKVLVGQVRPGILITEGWLREAAAAPDQVSSQRRILNVLTDHVDDVAPHLARRMLANRRNGAEIAWLTPSRMTGRFLTGWNRDVLARYDL